MPRSTTNDDFLLADARHFDRTGEALVELAHSHQAGNRDFTLFDSIDELQRA